MGLLEHYRASQSPTLRAASVRVSRQIKAPPERIFDACLDSEAARAFLFAGRTSEAISSEIDARVGGKFRIVRRRGGEDIEYSGVYLEIDRPQRLVFSLFVERYAQRDDRVVVELAPLGEQSLLVLNHELSLRSPAGRARIQSGWATAIEALAALCNESPSYMPVRQPRAPALARF